ncbi:hypothetical protein J421_2736 [Gemmatirosa kalamazoonensis]|uniref:Peptidase M1 membrane alanine aminopeptidase domain-containing protein n=1 Tax=Gemmatirosa kalamazoonensis TaxID=861299 RepID=W0RLH5_9BACT|nr:M1 family aminopeptidase [Gemmatirosa kalamazoonensis]AHG90273.1 hypothetical protein J421_2736 [Gemmatirosa kalamazoonensis]
MLRQILFFEIRYQLRRPATWLYFAILFLLAFGFLSSDAVEIGGGRGKVLKNAPWVLANTTIILTAIGQVITSALVGTSILRDFQTRTHELLFTTRISRVGYLAGRFGGAFVAMLVVYLAIPLGALVGSVMPWIDHDKMLPIHLANYLHPFLLLGLTNVLFISAAFFAAGALTRNQFVVYTMGIFLLVAWSVTGQLTRDLRNDWIGALLDPFGIQPFTLATRYWTVADKNTLLVPLSGFVLWNRLAWLAVSGGLVALTLGAFRFRAQPASLGLRWRHPKLAVAGVPGGLGGDDRPGITIGSRAAHAAAERLATAWAGVSGAASRGRQLLAVTRLAFASMTRQVSFLAIATVGAVNVIMSAWFANRMDQVTVYPRTYLIADAVVGGFGLFFVILLTTFVGELVWRERQLGADQIQDALPVSPALHLVGRAAGLVGAMAVLQAVLILAGIAVQTVKGYHEYELSVYLRTVFLIEFPFVLQYALLAFVVHTVVNNKAVGHVLLLAWWVSLITLDTLGFEHLLYQFGVRILEFPRYATFAQSFPNTIPFSEGIGFITEADKDDAGRDLPFMVTAHEVAHQWWGHQVMPAGVQGETMLVESMAEYSALMTTEKEYGRHAMEKYLRAELDWYLRGRGTEDKRELPLALVEGQGYIRYGKGGLTLYALRDYIGEDAMNRALSSYVRKVAFQEAPFTTTKDLLAEFRAVTPDSLQYLVKDLFETITLWDLKTDTATAVRRADGKWVVTLGVAAKKVRADTAGAERPIPMGDYVTVGVFGPKKAKDDALGEPLYLGKHRITAATSRIEVVVDRPPERAGIDPYHLLIDRNHKDNVRDVERH